MVAKSPEQIFIQSYFLFGTIRDLLPFEMLMKIFARARNMEGKKPERKRLSSSSACQRYLVRDGGVKGPVSYSLCSNFRMQSKSLRQVWEENTLECK